MNETPLVSVLMTAYNREKYIAEAIESVLASNYTNFELIIVDDCSSDKTVEIAKFYQLKDLRIKVYINEQNLGDYYNRNKAASYASGKYLKYLDSDDIIYPWGLFAMVSCMEKFPQAGFGLVSKNNFARKPYPYCIMPVDIFRRFYFTGELISMGPLGSIIKTEVFKDIGGFSGTQYIGDTEMWYNLGRKFPLVCMPSDLIWWREHDSQQIKSELKDISIRHLRYQISKDALLSDSCPLPKDEKKMALQNVKNLYCRNILILFLKGYFKRAIQLMKSGNISIMALISSLKRNRYPHF